MDQKIGVYICSGCGIGESIDVEALSAVATGEFSVAKCASHAALCGEEGVFAYQIGHRFRRCQLHSDSGLLGKGQNRRLRLSTQ